MLKFWYAQSGKRRGGRMGGRDMRDWAYLQNVGMTKGI
jgi:hypothetical protein